MVNTPWVKDPVPFSPAAQIGTEKVIEEHSAIGVVVTTDGSFTGIERDNYIKAEQIIDKLKISKPFVIILKLCKALCEGVCSTCRINERKIWCYVYALTVSNLEKKMLTGLYQAYLRNFLCPSLILCARVGEVLESSHWLKTRIADST
ncbi:MAG: hypothetical protein ACLS9K_10030 [Lachnospira eligens]